MAPLKLDCMSVGMEKKCSVHMCKDDKKTYSGRSNNLNNGVAQLFHLAVLF